MLADADYMDRALFMAARGRGRTTPNPMVGAVIVSDEGVVVGAGYHMRAGEPHAEVHALRQAGAAARGATLYCTLEPCCHHGRTPPCADAVIAAGIARVVMAIEDPNPRVAGGGTARLREHGVRVDAGVGRDAAMRLNRPFFSVMQRQRPWVIAKVAASLDGRVAGAPGARTKLTCVASDRCNQMLRAEVDAIAVGSGTVLADDPLLTVRDVYRERPITRVVLDRRLRTPASARLLRTLSAGPVLVVTTAAAAREKPHRVRDLEQAGATLVEAEAPGMADAMRALVEHGVQSLLLEGGPVVHAAAFAAHVVDAVRLFITPTSLGPDGVPWLSSQELPWGTLRDVRVQPCGEDVMIEGDVYRVD